MSSIDLILILQVFCYCLFRKLTNEGIKDIIKRKFLAKIQTKIAIQKIRTQFKGKISIKYSSSIGDKDNSSKAWEKHGFGIFTNSLTKELVSKM